MKSVFFFHTTLNTLTLMKELFRKRFPDVRIYNIVDDSILDEVKENGCKYTSEIVKRLIEYGTVAQSRGAVAIVNMCTTLGEAVQDVQKALSIPFLSIDTPMMSEMLHYGRKIAIIVTADTTIGPTTRAAMQVAERNGSDAEIDVIYVKGAFEALTQRQDRETHDRLVINAIRDTAKTHDVVVLAQATMMDVAKKVGDIGKPVLSSPLLGLNQLEIFLK